MMDHIAVKATERHIRRLYRKTEDLAGSRRRRSARGVRGERRHPQDLMNWPTKASLRSRPTYSGVRSRALTSALPPSPTGNTVFAFIKPMTETPAPETLRTPATSWPICRGALAGLRSSAIASAG